MQILAGPSTITENHRSLICTRSLIWQSDGRGPLAYLDLTDTLDKYTLQSVVFYAGKGWCDTIGCWDLLILGPFSRYKQRYQEVHDVRPNSLITSLGARSHCVVKYTINFAVLMSSRLQSEGAHYEDIIGAHRCLCSWLQDRVVSTDDT